MKEKSSPELELLLFEYSAEGAISVMPFGIRSFVLDWEHMGKVDRQNGFDTEIAPVGVDELAAVSALSGASTWCRINREGAHTSAEIERAIAAGATGIFLPMVKTPGNVERFLRLVNDRCKTGILIETAEALTCVRDIATLPLDRVYFGLNDFAISRGGGSIFRAVLDGSVDRAREAFIGTKFGFGGVTGVNEGTPVPCARLIDEMARLDCQFSFLRRSFRRDVERLGVKKITEGIEAYWHKCCARNAAEIERDRLILQQILRKVCLAS